MWYIYLKWLTNVGSAHESHLYMVEADTMFMDASYEIGGGLDNGKTPMSEESLRIPTPML